MVGKVLTFTLKFDIVEFGHLKLKGEVEWSAHKSDGTCHSGLRFRDLSPDSMRILARYIQSTRHAQGVAGGG